MFDGGGELVVAVIRRNSIIEIKKNKQGIKDGTVTAFRNTNDVEHEKYAQGKVKIIDSIFQSFEIGEVTVEIAGDIALLFVHFYVPGYEVIVYTNNHKDGIDNQIVIYADEDYDKSLYLSDRPGLHETLDMFDRICQLYGISNEENGRRAENIFGLSRSDFFERMKKEHVELERLYMNLLLEDVGENFHAIKYIKRILLLNDIGLMLEGDREVLERKVYDEFMWRKGF